MTDDTKPVPDSQKAQGNPTVRAVVDYLGLAVFIAAYFLTGKDMVKATWGLMAGSVLGVLVGLVFERRVAPMPLFTAIAGLLFGGLALVFHNSNIIKMKPTAINLVFGFALLGGAAMRKNPLKALLGEALHMDAPAWRILTVRYGCLFIVQAIVNEVFWRTQPEALWVTFHMPVLLAMSVIFSISQAPFMMKHAHDIDPDKPSAS